MSSIKFDLKTREDRICEYLAPHLRQYVFDELSDNYLEKAGITDILKGIPIPIKRTAISKLSTLEIAKNMAFVIGCDPHFSHCQNYVDYIIRIFGVKFSEGLINEGVEGAALKDYDYACINFRAALLINQDGADALYCYGRACKDSYELGEEEDFVARYKAESIEAFEILTLVSPNFPEGFYFLGYGYLNLGLYIKAKLTWESFMKFSKNPEQLKEIQERLNLLDEPVEIEKGYNLIATGKFSEGLKKLLPYKNSKFNNWWPLWYYLGVAATKLGFKDDAINYFLETLKLSPSNLDTMEELTKLYEEKGDAEKSLKYKNKIEIVKNNIEKDKLQKESQSKLS